MPTLQEIISHTRAFMTMELLLLVAALCFCLCSTLIIPCSSRQLHLHSSSYPHHGASPAARPKELLHTQPPRMEGPMKSLQVNNNEHKDGSARVVNGEINNGKNSDKQSKDHDHDTPKSDKSGAHSDRNTNTKVKRREKERLQAYLLQLLRMDYARVRRRRPIHNRGVPAAP